MFHRRNAMRSDTSSVCDTSTANCCKIKNQFIFVPFGLLLACLFGCWCCFFYYFLHLCERLWGRHFFFLFHQLWMFIPSKFYSVSMWFVCVAFIFPFSRNEQTIFITLIALLCSISAQAQLRHTHIHTVRVLHAATAKLQLVLTSIIFFFGFIVLPLKPN